MFVLSGHMTHTDWYIHTCWHMNMYENEHMLQGWDNIIQRLVDVMYKGSM